MSYAQGWSDQAITNYCPNCGERVTGYRRSNEYSFDIGECDKCGLVFEVIEHEDSKREIEEC